MPMFFSKKKNDRSTELFNPKKIRLEETRLNDFVYNSPNDRAQTGEFQHGISSKFECESLYIIGLGHLGLKLCERIEEKINSSYSLTPNKYPELLTICDIVTNNTNDSIIKKINSHSLFSESQTLFTRRYSFYNRYRKSLIRSDIKNVIRGQLQSLGGGSYIFFVFDIYEIDSSLIFDLLTYCRAIGENSNLIFTIISGDQNSLTNQLNNDEAFAFLQELERMTFNQPNLITENQHEYKSFDYALIDYLFVTPEFLNEKVNLSKNNKSQEIDSTANFILTLLNKKNHLIFEHLNNELKKNGELQKRTDCATINLFEIDQVSINQNDIENYFSALLIDDVLTDLFKAETDSNSCFVNGEKSILEIFNREDFFSWLFSDVEKKKQIIYEPWDVDNFENHFLNILQSALDERLNKKRIGFTIIEELLVLKRNFERVQIEIRENKELINKGFERADRYYSEIISLMIKDLESIVDQIKNFQKGIDGSNGMYSHTTSPKDLNKDWRLIIDDNKNKTRQFQEDQFINLYYFSENKVANYKEKISQNSNCLLAVTDLNEFYTDNIRPELKIKKEVQSKYYQALYNRIYWKIEIKSKPTPKIKLLFFDETSQIIEFESNNLENFYACLFKFCMKQFDGIYNKNKSWIINKVKEKKILSSFRFPISRLENNSKMDLNTNNAMSNLTYLLCEDREVCDELINYFAPNIQSRQKSSIVHEIPLDVTALSICCGVPIDFIPEVFEIKQTVYKTPDLYLFPQEKNASGFENEIKRRLREKIRIPPDLCYLFWKKEYVITIINAFLLGLIKAEKKESSHNRTWVIPINQSENYFDLDVTKSENILEDLCQILEKTIINIPGSLQIQMNTKHPFNNQNMEQTMMNIRVLSNMELQKDSMLKKEKEVIDKIKDTIDYYRNSPKYYSLYQLLLICDLNLHESNLIGGCNESI